MKWKHYCKVWFRIYQILKMETKLQVWSHKRIALSRELSLTWFYQTTSKSCLTTATIITASYLIVLNSRCNFCGNWSAFIITVKYFVRNYTNLHLLNNRIQFRICIKLNKFVSNYFTDMVIALYVIELWVFQTQSKRTVFVPCVLTV